MLQKLSEAKISSGSYRSVGAKRVDDQGEVTHRWMSNRLAVFSE